MAGLREDTSAGQKLVYKLDTNVKIVGFQTIPDGPGDNAGEQTQAFASEPGEIHRIFDQQLQGVIGR